MRENVFFHVFHDFLTDRININAVVKQHCCDVASEDRVRVSEFMRDLVACRDCYEREGRCAVSKSEICDISCRLFACSCIVGLL